MCSLELCLIIILITSSPATATKYLNTSGDIMIGALFPIHNKGQGAADCGKVQVEDGMQSLETMLFILDEINQNDKILPGIKLGILAFDTCESPAYALEQSMDFIKGFIAHSNEHHAKELKEFECLDGSAPKYRRGSFDRVVALIAEQSSAVTMQLATMFRLFGTPIISYMATSPTLSNRNRFPTFFRTVPSDFHQAHAMLELIRHFNWTYVSIVYSDSEYGNQGYETLNHLAKDYGVCFSTPLRVSKEHFTDKDYDKIVEKLANNTDARVVVVFAEKPTVVLRLVESTRRQKVGNRFVWVGSHGWTVTDHSDHHLPVSSKLEESLAFNQPVAYDPLRILTPDDIESHQVLEGALAIQPLASSLKGFDEYFTNLVVDEHEKLNPWFREYWDAFFQCNSRIKTSNQTDNFTMTSDFKNPCKEGLKMSSAAGFKQHTLLHFVRDSVYAIAMALHNMKTDMCGEGPGLCGAMKHIENPTVIEYLSKVQFKDELGKPFKFLEGGDGPPRYSILNFQRTGTNMYQWIIIGNYTSNEDGTPKLFLDQSAVIFRNVSVEFPSSSCEQTCRPDQIKVREHEDTCCWSCVNCGPFEYLRDPHHCEPCPLGLKPMLNLTACEHIPEQFINYANPWAISALTVATVGIFFTVGVFYIFLINTNTPVIKASGRELSYLLLLGTFMEFSMTFVMVAPPTEISCTIVRFFLGFCYTLCYAAIVTKTNRISRIFNSGVQSMGKTRFTSPKSQLLITFILTMVEVIINFIWFIFDQPRVMNIYPSRDTKLRICAGLGDYSYLIGLSYPFILIGICTGYAFKTRKCPDGFNEARHIAFTNYTAIVIWLAFVPLYIASTSNAIRIVTLAMSLSLSGFVQLACLFLPKIYIVVFTPEKNTKEVVMGHARTSSFTTPTPSPGTPASNTGRVTDNNGHRNPSFENSSSLDVPRTIRFHPVISVVKPRFLDSPLERNNLINEMKTSSNQNLILQRTK